MHKRLFQYIRARISITDQELEAAAAQSRLEHFKKGQSLLQTGQYCRFIGFLNKGLIMTTIVDNEGREKATGFIYEGCFFTYTEGLASEIPSHKNFIALEDCEAIMLGKEDLTKILGNSPKLQQLLSQVLAEEVRNLLMNDYASKTLSLEERYQRIEKQFPDAFQRIPLKYLADYLNIEAQSLSRLRKRISGK